LLEFLEDEPTAYIDEMQDFLYDTFDIEVSLSTIGRTLKQQKWSKKACANHAAERSEQLCVAWRCNSVMLEGSRRDCNIMKK